MQLRHFPTDIHPEATKELTGTETLHEREELRSGSRADCYVDLVCLIVNQRTSRRRLTTDPMFAQEGTLTSLADLV